MNDKDIWDRLTVENPNLEKTIETFLDTRRYTSTVRIRLVTIFAKKLKVPANYLVSATGYKYEYDDVEI